MSAFLVLPTSHTKWPGAVYVPPFNSSGDATHVLSLCAVLKATNRPIPHIYIGETPQTVAHAARSAALTASLGFAHSIVPIKLTNWRPNSVSTQTAVCVGKQSASSLIDQKATTWLYCVLAAQLGTARICAITSAAFRPPMPPATASWVASTVTHINNAANGSDVVLFIERLASSSQPQHCIPPAYVAQAAQAVTKANCYHGILSPPGGSGSPMFPPTSAGQSDRVGYHWLLHELHQSLGARLKFIYGPTSGVLDAAPFMGIPTVTFHNRAARKRICAQDEREYMMEGIKRVIRVDGGFGSLQLHVASAIQHPPRLAPPKPGRPSLVFRRVILNQSTCERFPLTGPQP